jgi:hypothetical protein
MKNRTGKPVGIVLCGDLVSQSIVRYFDGYSRIAEGNKDIPGT